LSNLGWLNHNLAFYIRLTLKFSPAMSWMVVSPSHNFVFVKRYINKRNYFHEFFQFWAKLYFSQIQFAVLKTFNTICQLPRFIVPIRILRCFVISISSISMIGRFYNPENAFRYA
jgi:hypothetical protein